MGGFDDGEGGAGGREEDDYEPVEEVGEEEGFGRGGEVVVEGEVVVGFFPGFGGHVGFWGRRMEAPLL